MPVPPCCPWSLGAHPRSEPLLLGPDLRMEVLPVPPPETPVPLRRERPHPGPGTQHEGLTLLAKPRVHSEGIPCREVGDQWDRAPHPASPNPTEPAREASHLCQRPQAKDPTWSAQPLGCVGQGRRRVLGEARLAGGATPAYRTVSTSHLLARCPASHCSLPRALGSPVDAGAIILAPAPSSPWGGGLPAKSGGLILMHPRPPSPPEPAPLPSAVTQNLRQGSCPRLPGLQA